MSVMRPGSNRGKGIATKDNGQRLGRVDPAVAEAENEQWIKAGQPA